MSGCRLCPNLCGADRKTQYGLCLAPEEMIINRAALHFFEEPPISGTRGSGTVFFGGCTMKCVYCQNYAISRTPQGAVYTPKQLADTFRKLEEEGAHNINLVTPTHYADGIRKALDIYRPGVPVVYNTSGYELVGELKKLRGYVDIYLPDYKYADAALAEELSGRKNYPFVVREAIGEMLKQKSNRYNADGTMLEGVIVRHMVIPGETENSFSVLNTIMTDFGTQTVLSLMSQFTPIPGCSRLSRRLKPIEYKAVAARAERLGFENMFLQELSSAEASYTPDFDTGQK